MIGDPYCNYYEFRFIIELHKFNLTRKLVRQFKMGRYILKDRVEVELFYSGLIEKGKENEDGFNLNVEEAV